MSINSVQFQAGLSMAEFIARYGTEAKCYRALYQWRWPQGFRCPACTGRARSRFRRGTTVYYQCRACRHQTTLTAGTMFEGTKLPLRTWLLALHLLTATKTNLAALELMRHLGVNYKTAWRMKHKIMQAMAEREEPRRLNGFVQIDDAYLGGERNGGKRGRGAEGKQPFVIAVQTDARFAAPSLAVRAGAQLRQRLARGLDRTAPGARVRDLYRRSGLLPPARRRRPRPHHAGHRRRPCRHRGAGRALGERAAGQRQARHQRHLPRHPPGQVRAALPGRSRLPVQPSLPPA